MPAGGIEAVVERGYTGKRQAVINLHAAFLVIQNASALQNREVPRNGRPAKSDEFD